MSDVERIESDKLREIHFVSINSSCVLRSTYPEETLDYLIDRGLWVMAQLENRSNGKE